MIGRSLDPLLRMTTLRDLVPVSPDDLCASCGLSHAVRVALREVGLPLRHLHEEVFGF